MKREYILAWRPPKYQHILSTGPEFVQALADSGELVLGPRGALMLVVEPKGPEDPLGAWARVYWNWGLDGWVARVGSKTVDAGCTYFLESIVLPETRLTHWLVISGSRWLSRTPEA